MKIEEVIERVGRNSGRHIVLHDGRILGGDPQYHLLLNTPKNYNFHALPEFVTECSKHTLPDVLESILHVSQMKPFDIFNNGEDIVDGMYCLLLENGKAITGRVMRLREGNDEVFHFSGFLVEEGIDDSRIIGYALKQESLDGFTLKNYKIIRS